MVAIKAQVQRKFDTEEAILTRLYDTMKVGETQENVSIQRLAEEIGTSEGSMAATAIVLDDLGILSREVTYPGFQKTNVKWTLLVPRKEAWQSLQAWHQTVRDSPVMLKYPKHQVKPRKSNGAAPEEPTQIALATQPASEGEELVASAGPEAPSPFEGLRVLRKDESKALVEAAKQYANKSAFLAKKIEELRSEGFEIAEGALSLKRDERLEAVAMAIPYVESLENANERLLNQSNSGRIAIRELEDLRLRFARLKRENERLVADRSASAVAGRAE